MKLFKNLSFTDLLILIVPLSLVVPNCYTCLLGNAPFAEWMTAMLPFGIYMLLMSINGNTPRTSVVMLPLMILGAFQIVVSHLYHDGSPIGVDMFLNVISTNLTEVNELLSSLGKPIIFDVILYLPLLIISVIAWRLHRKAGKHALHLFRIIGLIISSIGLIACVYCQTVRPSYGVTTNLFPINSFYNLNEAAIRQYRLSDYTDTSDNFRYEASTDNNNDKELYIAVIGETSRADNWELLGYNRHTNPKLSQYGDSVIAFKYVFSESNTTHKSVPMLLSTLSSENYKDEIYRHKSIISAFKDAGFHTSFITVQKPNKSFTEYYANEAHSVKYITGHGNQPALDDAILPLIDSAIADTTRHKQLIVIHLYGSHYAYSDRYPSEYAVFTPDKTGQADCKYRQELINAYDNTIVYTDHLLSKLIEKTKSIGYGAALIYTSDHGEDIFDDTRKKFLHASPVPTYWQLHVPLLMYMNHPYTASHPDFINNALSNRNHFVSSSKSYSQTLMQLAGISSKYCNFSQSLLSKGFTPPERLHYLNDLNESVDLSEWGFTNLDMSNLNKLINNENK